MKRTRTISERRVGLPALLGASLALIIAGNALADAKGRKEDRQDRKDDRKEDRADRRDDRKDDREDRRDDRKDDRDEFKKEWKEKHSAWVDKRGERRDARREEVKKKWGELAERPAARAELRKHARRVARLERIIFVADATDKPQVSANAKALLEKERARHDARMAAIKAQPAEAKK